VKLSIIMPFLDSQEIVRRQLLFMHEQDYPDDVEILFMDDGSQPPLQVPAVVPKNFTLYATHDYRKWTSSLARNTGAKLAKGEYLFLVDGDYIITRDAVEKARQFTGDRLGGRRSFGVLTEEGKLTQDHDVLIEYGLLPERLKKRGTSIPAHANQFVMRKSLFEAMGGYDEKLILGRDYPQREDSHFRGKLRRWVTEGKATMTNEDRPMLYMFPNGQFCGDVDYNPFGLFHTLSRKTARNHWYHHPRYVRREETTP
jgi:glycosyltransferase involved in cell wall biosynthesis